MDRKSDVITSRINSRSCDLNNQGNDDNNKNISLIKAKENGCVKSRIAKEFKNEQNGDQKKVNGRSQVKLNFTLFSGVR